MINTPVNAIHNIDPLEGINWNNQPDPTDGDIWDRLTTNFWLPEKIPVSNDVTSWRNMTSSEQDATLKVFTGLTVLDTLQGTVGAVSLIPHAVTPQEEAVYTNIAFMESVHAKSYSNIFMTLASTPEIDEAFRWSRENEHMQYKARRILAEYATGDHERMMIASVMLESFLFYSGFYLPLRMASLGKITNAADIIRLIIRDESVHGWYIGYKYQQKLERDKARHAANQGEVVDLLMDLYNDESHFTETVYDQLGWAEDVKAFLRYNANKAMNNLGYEAIFPQEECKFNAGVMASLDPSANENHDFFSGSGSSYVIGKAEETTDDDWDF